MEPRAKTFLIVGAGGHGRVVADLVRARGHRAIGFVDDDVSKANDEIDSTGVRVLMSVQELLNYVAAHEGLPLRADQIALGIGNNTLRLELFSKLRNYCDVPLVHPAAVISPSARLGGGTVVFARATINPEARVGNAVIVNTGAIIEHDCVLRDAVHVSPGAVLCGTVSVGARSWVGAGAVVIQNRSVGSDCIVGAGAVVVRDLPDDVIAYGNPARVQAPIAAER